MDPSSKLIFLPDSSGCCAFNSACLFLTNKLKTEGLRFFFSSDALVVGAFAF
jgi:hypothetical protein